MEEKKKNQGTAYLIVVLFLIIIIMLGLGFYMGYQSGVKVTGNNGETKKQRTATKQEQTPAKQEEVTKLAEQTTNLENIKGETIYLSGKQHKVNVEVVNGQKEADYQKVAYEVTIDGKKVEGIGSSGYVTNTPNYQQYKMYEILTIKDMNGTDSYVLLKTYDYGYSGTEEDLYIIDQNAQIIGKIFDYNVALAGFWEKNPNNEEDTSKSIEGKIYSDYIIYVRGLSGGGVEKHKYYIKNGSAVDELERKYSEGEYGVAGKKF